MNSCTIQGGELTNNNNGTFDIKAGSIEFESNADYLINPRRTEILRNNLALFKSRVRLPQWKDHKRELMLDIMGIEMELKSKGLKL